MTLLILLGMFLPWLEVSCSNKPIIEQSGFQVLIGDSTALTENPNSTPGATPTTETGTNNDSSEGDSYAAWWLAIFLLGGVLAGVGGVMALAGKRGGILAVAGAGVAAVTLTGSVAIGFPVETQIGEMNAKMASAGSSSPGVDGEMADRMSNALASGFFVKRKAGLWLSLAAVWLQLGCGVGLLVAGAAAGKKKNLPQPQPQPPPEQPQPPPPA